MTLHRQAQELLDSFASATGDDPQPERSVEEMRALSGGFRQMQGDAAVIGSTRVEKIPVSGGFVEATVYEPVGDAKGLVVYFHGGGFVLGAPRDFEVLYHALVAQSQVRLVAIDYRLAPEHPFPTGVDDSYAGLLWSAEHLANGLPIIVAGDSSGGTFAAVAARRARDHDGPALAAQVLVYPVTDHDFSRTSYDEHGDSGLLVGKSDMEWYWAQYASDPAVRDGEDASPLRAASFEGLPPAFVLVDEYDPVRDEAKAFADRLIDAKVPTVVDYVADQMHGYFTMANMMASADESIARVAAYIRSVVNH
ncbi:alpha/beta hydrolase [Rhodococcus wratislaviensis]|uniref:alpha/beta hydrolase n=1 Tax=Rhodococcus wratislaviensis TaxID=44752 RepID=UPI00365EC494